MGTGLIVVLGLSGCSSADGLVPAGELTASGAARHPLAAAHSASPSAGVSAPSAADAPIQVASQAPGRPVPGATAPADPVAAGPPPGWAAQDRAVALGGARWTAAGGGSGHVRLAEAVGVAGQKERPRPALPGTATVSGLAAACPPCFQPFGAGVAPAAAAAPNQPPRRRPPGWIQWFLANWGGDGCTWISAGATEPPIEVKRRERLRLCVEGYAENASPHLVITAPDGKRIEPAASASQDVATWTWDVHPGADGDKLTEHGTYRFNITGKAENDGPRTLVTSGRIVVTLRTQPGVAFTDDRGWEKRPLRPGESVRLWMAGYRPGQKVTAALYRQPPGKERLRFLKDLPHTVVDSYGEGMLRWVVPKEAVPGDYGIWVEAGPKSWGGCRVNCTAFEVGG